MHDRPGVQGRRAGVALLVAVLVAVPAACGQSRQETVAERGREVMPFDLDATTHEFVKAPDGGAQTVTSDDPDDATQVALVREHLLAEADAFRAGDFDDPVAIHGPEMPGVAEMAAGAGDIVVAYDEVAAGARLTYSTDDPHLVDAIHRWFDAQVDDHGAHAMAGAPSGT